MRNIPSPDSDVIILGIHAFHDTNINFRNAYSNTNSLMHTISFEGVGITLMSDIHIYGMMEKLQHCYTERCDDIFDMVNIYLHWRFHQLSDKKRRRVNISIGMIWPFKLLEFVEIKMYCLIPNSNNHAIKEVIESTMVVLQKSNNIHFKI